MRINAHPELLKVGDEVTTDYSWAYADVVRTITNIFEHEECKSGLRASASAGTPCPHCGMAKAQPIYGVDASWFIPVKEDNDGKTD